MFTLILRRPHIEVEMAPVIRNHWSFIRMRSRRKIVVLD